MLSAETLVPLGLFVEAMAVIVLICAFGHALEVGMRALVFLNANAQIFVFFMRIEKEAKQFLSKGHLIGVELSKSGRRSGSCGSFQMTSWPLHGDSGAHPA